MSRLSNITQDQTVSMQQPEERASARHLHQAGAPTCPTIPSYTVKMGVNHVGYAIDGSCYMKQAIEQTAQDCNLTPDCAAFNTLGCLMVGNDTAVNNSGSSNSSCLYSKTSIKNPVVNSKSYTNIADSANQCEPVTGYTAYPGLDHMGDDLPGPNCIQASVQSLAARCNELPWCVSFNLDGCLKYKETTTLYKPSSCFYVKVTAVACPHVPGFYVQQGRGYNDMNTTDGNMSSGRGCFRNVSIAQLAQECQADPTCNAFDSWGCLKNYTFLNDNALGPSYCFYTKLDGSTAETIPYCINGWDVAGTDVNVLANVTDLPTCQEHCRRNPQCMYTVFDTVGSKCTLRNDMFFGVDGYTEQHDNYVLCTKGTPSCPQLPGFRRYFFSENAGFAWGGTCSRSGLYPSDIAAQCMFTSGCAGFDLTGCMTTQSIITTTGLPICYWEKIAYQPGFCAEMPGYTALPGYDHYGDDLFNTCVRNQTIVENAAECNSTPGCTAFNPQGCLKNVSTITVNSFSDSWCFYTKNNASQVSLPAPKMPEPPSPQLAPSAPSPIEAPSPPQTSPNPQAGHTMETSAKHKSISTGAVVGVAVGGVAALLALVLLMTWRCRHQSHSQQPHTVINDHEVYARLVQKMADLPGIIRGEPFTRATAHEYTWNEIEDSRCLTAVGLNNEDELAVKGTAGPAIQLSTKEVKEQIKLLRHGLLGRGATALVFKALWPSRFGESAVLAVKVLQDGYSADMYSLQSFCYEASVLASLQPPHPNIVRLYGYCLEPPTVCLVLELLPGSLKKRLYPEVSSTTQPTPAMEVFINPATTSGLCSSSNTDTRTCSLQDTAKTASYTHDEPHTKVVLAGYPRMTMLDVFKISIDIVTALKHMLDVPLSASAAVAVVDPFLSEEAGDNELQNRKGTRIVHRDLKPANILLDAAGRAKITDFGLARQVVDETMETRNLAAGTTPYMAPETLVSRQAPSARFYATNRVDIYSMGLIMWEMLAGQRPWSNRTEQQIVNAVLAGQRPDLPMRQQFASQENCKLVLSEMPASLHALPELNSIIRACWNQKQDRRPSAAELYDMLTSLLEKYSCMHN